MAVARSLQHEQTSSSRHSRRPTPTWQPEQLAGRHDQAGRQGRAAPKRRSRDGRPGPGRDPGFLERVGDPAEFVIQACERARCGSGNPRPRDIDQIVEVSRRPSCDENKTIRTSQVSFPAPLPSCCAWTPPVRGGCPVSRIVTLAGLQGLADTAA